MKLPILQRIENLRVLAREYHIDIVELHVSDKDYKAIAGKISKQTIQLRYIFNDTVFTVLVSRRKRTTKNLT